MHVSIDQKRKSRMRVILMYSILSTKTSDKSDGERKGFSTKGIRKSKVLVGGGSP